MGNILRCYLHAADLWGRDGKSQKQKAKRSERSKSGQWENLNHDRVVTKVCIDPTESFGARMALESYPELGNGRGGGWGGSLHLDINVKERHTLQGRKGGVSSGQETSLI